MELRVSFRYGVQVTSNCSQPLWKVVTDVSQKTWNPPESNTANCSSIYGAPLFPTQWPCFFQPHTFIFHNYPRRSRAHNIPILERDTDPESYHQPDVQMLNYYSTRNTKGTLELWAPQNSWCLSSLHSPQRKSKPEVNIDHCEMGVLGILVVWKEKHEPLMGLQNPRDSPLGQDLSRGAQDTTCHQMDEANSTSQHFDSVSKFSVYNLNPPEVIWVSCPILPHKSRKKYKESKMTLEKTYQKREMVTLSDAITLQFGQRPNWPKWLRWEREREGHRIYQVTAIVPALAITTKKSSIIPRTLSLILHFIELEFKF